MRPDRAPAASAAVPSRGFSRGFTLLEAVVALAILGVAGVAVLEALGGEVRGAERARAASTAAALAQDRLATLALLPASAIDPPPDSLARGTFGAPFTGYRWTASIRPVFGEADLYQAQVEIAGLAHYVVATRLYQARPRGAPQ